jgi:hypothetical protein
MALCIFSAFFIFDRSTAKFLNNNFHGDTKTYLFLM